MKSEHATQLNIVLAVMPNSPFQQFDLARASSWLPELEAQVNGG